MASFRPQAKPESREPGVPSAGVRREAPTPPPAVIPAKAGIQYPPGRVVSRKQQPEAVRRRCRSLGRATCGYWFPVSGFAGTGMTFGV